MPADHKPKLSNAGIRFGPGRPSKNEEARRIGLKDEKEKATARLQFWITPTELAEIRSAFEAAGGDDSWVDFVLGAIRDGLESRGRAVVVSGSSASSADLADLKSDVNARMKALEDMNDAMLTMLRTLGRHQKQTAELVDGLGVKIDTQLRALEEVRPKSAQNYRGENYSRKLPFDSVGGSAS
jgi:hypothetical protein